jgi:hypothetical protein
MRFSFPGTEEIVNRRPLLACLASLVLTGCLTHIPPNNNLKHMAIDWAPDFASAQERALATGKPILMVMAAGQITGFT